MAKIEVGRWAEQLRRMFGMAGVDQVAGDLSPEISPVVVIDTPTADLAFLKSERQVFFAITVAAAAGFNSKVRIRNPPASGCMALMKLIVMTSPSTANLRINVNQFTTDLTPADTTVPDPRWGALGLAIPASTLVASGSADQASDPGGEPLLEQLTLSNTPVRMDQAFPMLPGVGIDMGHTATNITLRVWATWIERGFPELER